MISPQGLNHWGELADASGSNAGENKPTSWGNPTPVEAHLSATNRPYYDL